MSGCLITGLTAKHLHNNKYWLIKAVLTSSDMCITLNTSELMLCTACTKSLCLCSVTPSDTIQSKVETVGETTIITSQSDPQHGWKVFLNRIFWFLFGCQSHLHFTLQYKWKLLAEVMMFPPGVPENGV